MGALMASGLTTLKIGKKGSGLLLTRYWLNILKEGKGDFKQYTPIIQYMKVVKYYRTYGFTS